MKSLYIDIQLGVSGDMLLGALIDLGLDTEILFEMLKKLQLQGWEISPKKVIRNSLAGISAGVSCKVDHTHRNLSDILSIIRNAGYNETTSGRIERVFETLARAEAAAHDTDISNIHFHETGAIDSIVDITAFCLALEILNIDNVYFNTFNFGTGTVIASHGEIPVPSPATVLISKGFETVFTSKHGELVTPSAAAILTSIGKQCAILPSALIESNGTGFGTRDYGFLSCTRAFLLHEDADTGELVFQVECNIDDMNPQLVPYIINKCIDAGALDAYCTQILMKKGRPGFLVTIVVTANLLNIIRQLLYTETTTLGLRIYKMYREKATRDFTTITVNGENIRIKRGKDTHGLVTVHPEYEDCRNVAEKRGISLKKVFYLAQQEYFKKNPL